MRVIAVLDLLAGQAVHARAGARERYAPVATVAGGPIEPGNALALARGYLERTGVRELYAADLDAIMRGAPQESLVSELTGLGVPLWLDAGVTSPQAAERVIALGVVRVVVGLETLPSFEVLGEICDRIGGERVAFSLDLRAGQPLADHMSNAAGDSASQLARRAESAGATAIIVLDLARVGTGTGLDLPLIGLVRKAAPHVTLLAGGGVRGRDDLARLEDIGCDGALVGTALMSGDLGDLKAV